MEHRFDFTEWPTDKLVSHLEETVKLEQALGDEYRADIAREIAMLSFELLQRGDDMKTPETPTPIWKKWKKK